MTYNHENFISQCLDGFVMQETNFPFEILVHEDASTDNTANIVKEYELKYPHLFRCVYQTENQFAKQNTLTNILFPMAHGKYIALCEGDDYWTDPYKLQKQIDFLEANNDYACCVTESIMDYGTYQKRYTNKDSECDIDGPGILAESYYATNTFVFRNKIIELGQIFKESPLGDTLLLYLLSLKGKIKYLPVIIGVYRKHSGGIFTGTDGIILMKRQLKFYELLKEYGYLNHIRILNRLIQDFKINIVYQHIYRGEKKTAMIYLKQLQMGTFIKKWKVTLKCLGHLIIK